MNKIDFKPGFRLSLIDIIVLVSGIVSSIYISKFSVIFSIIIAFVIIHFFMFCNIFRISRPPELFWAGMFVSLSTLTAIYNIPGWIVTLSTSMVLTFVLLWIELKKPSYHGVLWKTFNPKLPEWYENILQKRKK